MHDTSEPDWRIFRELHKIALQRFCDKVLREASAIIANAEVTPHERYGDLFQLIQKRDDEVARLFNDSRRSNCLVNVVGLLSEQLITDAEFARFSEPMRASVLTALEALSASSPATRRCK